ncbi:hypothetical protein DNK06_23380 [Pseudomonas daroniae]|uniref:Uncharacterized protein n=1 Tax=Phytopseudomonas daroniae TaxID=2487519 RepID=A0A4Q9QFC3_9GAMM|nr:hypothetical protein DNK06_23380 [Pseudomonas daroniae]TBU75694.1 hypothetical protein DNK31_22895 [Pseudomonas sp. FRB 228]TBU87068.1 hypothetical protein DNJ99_22775 [Pseudomonas daroniae]
MQRRRDPAGNGARWYVRLGKCTLIFDGELAARTFAAPLHRRLNGDKRALLPEPDEPPGT